MAAEAGIARLREVAEKQFGILDLSEEHRFAGEKVQWNHSIPSGVSSLANDTIMVSPRWLGRGGKAAFTAHAIYLAIRIELELLDDPPEELKRQLAHMENVAKSAQAAASMKRDEDTVKMLMKCASEAHVDVLQDMIDTAMGIANNSLSNLCRRDAAGLVQSMKARMFSGA